MLLLSCTLRHVRYIIMTQQSIKHSDRKYLCIQSKADFLIDTYTQTHHMNKSRHMFTRIYKLHQKNMHTHILQEYQLKPCDGNGTRELNIGVLLHALKCDRSMAVPSVGSVMACPVWLPCSVPQTRKRTRITVTATVCIYAFIQ